MVYSTQPGAGGRLQYRPAPPRSPPRMAGRVSLASLIELCRAVRHGVGAGLSVVEVFKMQARRGPRDLRDVAGRMAASMEAGNSLRKALQQEERAFPPLFLSLARVGEESGLVPEVF